MLPSLCDGDDGARRVRMRAALARAISARKPPLPPARNMPSDIFWSPRLCVRSLGTTSSSTSSTSSSSATHPRCRRARRARRRRFHRCLVFPRHLDALFLIGARCCGCTGGRRLSASSARARERTVAAEGVGVGQPCVCARQGGGGGRSCSSGGDSRADAVGQPCRCWGTECSSIVY